jgi:hypothetical protein
MSDILERLTCVGCYCFMAIVAVAIGYSAICDALASF